MGIGMFGAEHLEEALEVVGKAPVVGDAVFVQRWVPGNASSGPEYNSSCTKVL
jgi:hypothetical protein